MKQGDYGAAFDLMSTEERSAGNWTKAGWIACAEALMSPARDVIHGVTMAEADPGGHRPHTKPMWDRSTTRMFVLSFNGRRLPGTVGVRLAPDGHWHPDCADLMFRMRRACAPSTVAIFPDLQRGLEKANMTCLPLFGRHMRVELTSIQEVLAGTRDVNAAGQLDDKL